MPYSYEDVIVEIIANANVERGDIFEYEFSPLIEIFDRYFQFSQENLTEECDEYDIQPAKFYFRTEYSVNARASQINGYFIIAVNMGTVVALYYLFYEENYIFEENDYMLKNFKELTDTFDVPPGHLMFQLATLFTFYHERAHLIQRSPYLVSSLSEMPTNTPNKDFDIIRHVLELDADIDASHQICFHLIEYHKKLNGREGTLEQLQKLLSIGVASIFSYFLTYYDEEVDIYYREYSHPHPLVRISYIVDCIILVAEKNMPEEFCLDKKKTLRDAFAISDVFFKSVQNSDIVENFAGHFMAESANIEVYVNELLGIGEAIPYLVKNRNIKK